VRHEDVASPWGHDSFLMDVPIYHAHVRDFLG
jgi:homoserine acetyltransferase